MFQSGSLISVLLQLQGSFAVDIVTLDKSWRTSRQKTCRVFCLVEVLVRSLVVLTILIHHSLF
jgi:hypothetical protein